MWSELEKQQIESFISTQPEAKINWKACAKVIQTKDARQCYDYHALQMNGKQRNRSTKHKWTQEELDALRDKDASMGWKEFQESFLPHLSIS